MVMRRTFTVALVPLWLVGCGGSPSVKVKNESTSTAVTVAQTGQNVARGEQPTPAPTATTVNETRNLEYPDLDVNTLGYRGAPTRASNAAFDVHDRAMALLRQQQYERAKEGLMRAVAMAPDETLFRYSLGRAYAVLGEYQEATKLVRQVLREDYARYWFAYLLDDEWRYLRQTPFGEQIRDDLERIRQTVVRATRTGLPLVYWHDGGSVPHAQKTASLRAGIYRPDLNRYFAMVPPKENAVMAIVEKEYHRVLYLTNEGNYCMGFTCPKPNAWGLYSWPWHASQPGYEGVFRTGSTTQKIGAVWLEPTEDGARARVPAYGVMSGHWWLLFNSGGFEQQECGQKTAKGKWYYTDMAGVLTGTEKHNITWDWDTLVLEDGRTVFLGAEHRGAEFHSIEVSPSKDLIVAISMFYRCQCPSQTEPLFKHVISKVHVSPNSLSAEPARVGPNEAIAYFDDDSTLYTQTNGVTQRGDGLRLPQGLYLSVPHTQKLRCCGRLENWYNHFSSPTVPCGV